MIKLTEKTATWLRLPLHPLKIKEHYTNPRDKYEEDLSKTFEWYAFENEDDLGVDVPAYSTYLDWYARVETVNGRFYLKYAYRPQRDFPRPPLVVE